MGTNEPSHKVSIIILVSSTDSAVDHTVLTVLRQKCPIEKEVIVIDDRENKTIYEELMKFPIIHKKIPPCGRAKARNVGIGLASGDLICFIDSDCIPQSDWLETLVSGQISVPEKVVAIGGSLKAPFREMNILEIADHFSTFYMYSPKKPKTINLLYPVCANLIIRKEVFEKIGNFDELQYHEDFDLAVRIVKEGYYILFQPESIVFHHHKIKNYWSYLMRRYNYGLGTMQVVIKHSSATRQKVLPVFRIYLFIAEHPLLLIFCSPAISVALTLFKILQVKCSYNKHLIFSIPLIFLGHIAWIVGACSVIMKRNTHRLARAMCKLYPAIMRSLRYERG